MRMANAIGAADTELDLLDQLFASESEDDDNVQPVTESFTPGESEQGPESTRPLKRAHTLCSQAKADTSRQPSLPTPLSKIADTIHMHGDALISAVACLLEHLALHAMQAAWRGEWSVDIPCALHTSSAAVTSDASEAATFMHAKATELPGSQHTDHALTAPACASQAFDPWNGHATSLHRCDARQAQPLMAATAAKLTTETGWRTVKEAALACCAAAGSAQLSSGDARLMQTLRVQDLLHACTPCGAAVQRCMHGMLMQPPCAYTQPSPQPHSSSGCSCSSLHPRSTEQTAKGSSIHTDDQGAEPMGPGPWVSHACACAHAPARMLRAPHASCVPPGLVLIKHWLSAQQQAHLLRAIAAEGWMGHAADANQAIRFGALPAWALELTSALPLGTLLPPHLAARAPAADQMIVNLYRPGDGIVPHVDLARFQDGILVVSLGSPAVMRFKRVCTAAQCPHCSVLDAQYVQHASEHSPDDALQSFGSAHDNIKQCQNAKDGECLDSGPCCIVPQGQTISMQHTAGQHASSSCFASSHCHRHGNGCSSGIMCSSHFSMLLQGGDVLALSGAARYCWSHGIDSTHVESMTHGPLAAANDVAAVAAEGGAHAAALHADVSAGGVVVRGVRVSITLRRMCLDASGSIMLHHEHLA